MAKRSNPATTVEQNNTLKVHKDEGEELGFAIARAIMTPHFRHAVAVSSLNKTQFGDMDGGGPGLADYADALVARSKQAVKGDLDWVSSMLAAQAVTLDNVFTEMARRMARNMGEHLNATEIYARYAMKAQAQSRATLEALAKLHQPREQTVRHVHVNEGGQAVIADQFHHHAGGQENGKNADQPHEQSPYGPALLGQDPFGNAVPITGVEGQAALSPSRRAVTGGT